MHALVTPDPRQEVARRLRLLLDEASKTQMDVERETAGAISQSALSEWMRGISTPRVDALVWLAHHFRVSTDWLLGLTDARQGVVGKATQVVDDSAVARIMKGAAQTECICYAFDLARWRLVDAEEFARIKAKVDAHSKAEARRRRPLRGAHDA